MIVYLFFFKKNIYLIKKGGQILLEKNLGTLLYDSLFWNRKICFKEVTCKNIHDENLCKKPDFQAQENICEEINVYYGKI